MRSDECLAVSRLAVTPSALNGIRGFGNQFMLPQTVEDHLHQRLFQRGAVFSRKDSGILCVSLLLTTMKRPDEVFAPCCPRVAIGRYVVKPKAAWKEWKS